MKLGLQLYTVRDLLAADFHGTLNAISKLGIDGVELAGQYGSLEPVALKSLLNDLTLEVAGMHVMLDTLETDLDAQINAAHALGAGYLVCPWLDAALYVNGWDAIIQRLQTVKQRLEGSGVGLAYHNHTFELDAQPLPLEAIAAAGIPLEFDIAWSHAAGVDPSDFLARHAGQIPLLHVKDVARVSDAPGMDGWRTVELGRGHVPIGAAISAAQAAGVEWALLEQDACEGSALESVRISLEWWRLNRSI
jgi:sugar phosphate isomerase/epimerase